MIYNALQKKIAGYLLKSSISTLSFALLVNISISNAAVLDLNINNIKSSGQICIAIYKSPDLFYQEKRSSTCRKNNKDAQYHLVEVKNNQSKLHKAIDLKQGIYAIKVFIDKNRNKKLDYNFLGLAKEQFGYSNNPKFQFLYKPPYFSEIEFGLSGHKKMEINL